MSGFLAQFACSFFFWAVLPKRSCFIGLRSVVDLVAHSGISLSNYHILQSGPKDFRLLCFLKVNCSFPFFERFSIVVSNLYIILDINLLLVCFHISISSFETDNGNCCTVRYYSLYQIMITIMMTWRGKYSYHMKPSKQNSLLQCGMEWNTRGVNHLKQNIRSFLLTITWFSNISMLSLISQIRNLLVINKNVCSLYTSFFVLPVHIIMSFGPYIGGDWRKMLTLSVVFIIPTLLRHLSASHFFW